ncbi:MAG: class II aldolase/adducin family protein [Lachnospiraceae bacterium]|nr:class II aldolase/adducin family protein [Lachnospiraceae bacterium]
MDWASIKEDMISAEQRMEEAGLCMRLGGSISCRIDEESFFFAGGDLRDRPIEPDEIRRVRFRRAQGEAGIHAAIYRVRSDIHAVAFTRQCFGSALGVLNQDRLAAEDASGSRVKILVVPFTMPGSDAQRSHVYRLASKDRAAGFLIAANHGAFAYGRDTEEMFASAISLERFAKLFLKEIGNTTIPCQVVHGFDSERTGDGIRFFDPGTPGRVRQIHEQIYDRRPDVGYIVHNRSEAAVTVSRLNDQLFALYDDFVELIGSGVPVPRNLQGADGRDGIYVSDDVNASFCYDDGAFCYGRDARAADLAARSLEKACIAQIAAARMDGANVLSRRDVRRLNRRKG